MTERWRTAVSPSSIALTTALVLAWASLHALWPSLSEFVISIDHCGLLFCDYTRHYAPMGAELFEARVPTRGFYYSPFFALGMAMLVALPAAVQFWIWFALQVAAGALLVWVTARRFGANTPWVAASYLFVFTTSVPVLNNFKWGQLSVFMTLCMVVALISIERGRRGFAACVLSIAISIKFYPALLLIYGFGRREWRFIGLTLAGCTVLMLVLPAAALGLRDTLEFYRALDPLDPFGTTGIARNANSQYFGHVIQRLLPSLGEPPVRALGYAIAMANVWLALRVSRTRADPGPAALALMLLSIPFVLRTSWPHYFVYLPAIQLIVAFWALERTGFTRTLMIASSIAAALLSSALAFDLMGRAAYGTYGALFWANALLLLAVWVQGLGNPQPSESAPESTDPSANSSHSGEGSDKAASAMSSATLW